jgi:hypothetical protein
LELRKKIDKYNILALTGKPPIANRREQMQRLHKKRQRYELRQEEIQNLGLEKSSDFALDN